MNAQTFAETLAKAKADKAAFDEMRKTVESAPDTANGTAWRDELLAVPEQLSPRLKWMQEHNIQTHPPGWIQKPSQKLMDWLTAKGIALSPPLEGEWDEWAVCDENTRCGEGRSISDALQSLFRHGGKDVGVHPEESRMNIAKAGEWSAVSGFKLESGVTEDEAIVALAKANGWKLWFESK